MPDGTTNFEHNCARPEIKPRRIHHRLEFREKRATPNTIFAERNDPRRTETAWYSHERRESLNTLKVLLLIL